LSVELLPVPILEPAMLPEVLRDWLVDCSQRMSAPLDFFGAPAIVGLASVLGKKVCVRPKERDDWTVCPNLWGAAVGPPSVLKSACAEEALRPLHRLVKDALQAHQGAHAQHAQDAIIAKAKAAAAKDAMKLGAKKGKLSDVEMRLLAQVVADGENVEPPPPRRYVVNDTTVEKLGVLLKENPNGLLLFRDELTGFLRSLDRQGHESDRGFYLEGWNGLTPIFFYDRIGRGSIPIENLCLSIFGGIQPGPWSRYIRTANSGDLADGLVPRFQVAVYPDIGSWVDVDRWPDTQAKNRAYAVFQAFDSLDPAAVGARLDDQRGVFILGFNQEGQAIFNDWRTSLEMRLRSGCDSSMMQHHLGKYRKLQPSLALLFHLVEVVTGHAAPGAIPETAALAAAAWCELLEAHARRIYQAAMDGDPETVGQLAERIKTSLPSPFRVRDVQRKGWAGLDRAEIIERLLLVLEDRRWVKAVEAPASAQGGHPTWDYWINPAIKP
jgi:putative DNA primase/helicase